MKVPGVHQGPPLVVTVEASGEKGRRRGFKREGRWRVEDVRRFNRL